MKKCKEWYERTAKGIKGLVLNQTVLAETIEISEASRANPGSETLGYIQGVMEEGIFYAQRIERVSYGVWHKARIAQGNGHQRSFLREADQRDLEVQTVCFHSHPGENVRDRQCWPQHYKTSQPFFERTKLDFEQGLYGSTTLEEVLNEGQRELSLEDINNIPGEVTVLISPTYRVDNEVSHLQAYRLGPDAEIPEIREMKGTLPIQIQSKYPAAVRTREVLLKKIEQGLTQRARAWFARVEKEIEPTQKFTYLTRLPYYLEQEELESMSLKDAIALTKEREAEKAKLDALVLT